MMITSISLLKQMEVLLCFQIDSLEVNYAVRVMYSRQRREE